MWRISVNLYALTDVVADVVLDVETVFLNVRLRSEQFPTLRKRDCRSEPNITYERLNIFRT